MTLAQDEPLRATLSTSYTIYPNVASLPPEWHQLAEAAQQACDGSYSPYSQLAVGAAVLLNNGEIIQGANQENAAYPSGLCAERVAIFAAQTQYPKAHIMALALAARQEKQLLSTPITPCGACRQVLAESCAQHSKPVPVILLASGKCIIVDDARELLPLSFQLPME